MIIYFIVAVCAFAFGFLFSLFFIPFLDFIDSKIQRRRIKKKIEIQFIKDLISMYPEAKND